MIPLRDTQKISTFPLVTIVIISINVIVFLIMLFQSVTFKDPGLALNNFYLRYGLIPYQITTGNYIVPSLRPAWLTIFSSMFLHGGFTHIIGNLWYFWIFGNNV
ncbi:MAG: rhomboid family intramembrane serine protease, partial [Caldisericota bacterium]|nr:rhomboid family intramembrane serine protease [Caldisericota bacterium]